MSLFVNSLYNLRCLYLKQSANYPFSQDIRAVLPQSAKFLALIREGITYR